MSTSALIGVYHKGKVNHVYNHFDGYIEEPGLGAKLLKHYNDRFKALKLVQRDIRSVEDDGFIDHLESGDSATIEDEESFYKHVDRDPSIGFVYLFKNDKWYVYWGDKVRELSSELDVKEKENIKQQEELFTDMQFEMLNIIVKADKQHSKYGTDKSSKESANLVQQSLRNTITELEKKGYKVYTVDDTNKLIQNGHHIIVVNRKGDYFKVLSDGKVYGMEMYRKGTLVEVMYNNFTVSQRNLKRRPNNINSLVKYMYGIS